MKLAYSVGTPEVNVPLMAFCGDFEQNVADIKAIGYEAIELFVRSPKEMRVDDVRRVIDRSGLEVAAIATNPAMLQDGLNLLHPDADIRRQAVERVIDLIDFSAEYHAPVCIGKYRGQIWKGDEDAAWRELGKALKRICDHAGEKGASIMLEPQTKNGINNLNTTAETSRWIDSLGFNNLGILYDTYHGQLDETSVASGIVEAGGKIGFVHLSDSNRLPPGTGNIDFADSLAVLKAIGFDGYLSMEIAQRPSGRVAAETAFKTIDYILKYVI